MNARRFKRQESCTPPEFGTDEKITGISPGLASRGIRRKAAARERGPPSATGLQARNWRIAATSKFERSVLVSLSATFRASWPSLNRFRPLDVFPGPSWPALPRLRSVGAQTRPHPLAYGHRARRAVGPGHRQALLQPTQRSGRVAAAERAQRPRARRVAFAHAWPAVPGRPGRRGLGGQAACGRAPTRRPRGPGPSLPAELGARGSPGDGYRTAFHRSAPAPVHGPTRSRDAAPAHRRPHPLRVDEGAGHAP